MSRLDTLDVYFPFADGVPGYPCGEGDYRCCRGAGFGATKMELVQLSAKYPFLAMFVQPRREPELPLVQLTNFATRSSRTSTFVSTAASEVGRHAGAPRGRARDLAAASEVAPRALGETFEWLAIPDAGVRAQLLQSFTCDALGHFRFDSV